MRATGDVRIQKTTIGPSWRQQQVSMPYYYTVTIVLRLGHRYLLQPLIITSAQFLGKVPSLFGFQIVSKNKKATNDKN